MNQEEKNKRLEDTIESYHKDFHNFIDLIKLGKWEALGEKEKKEERGKMKEKVEYYLTHFKNHPDYTETLPYFVKYFGDIK